MTRIKFCGLSRIRDIEAANALTPDYVGFVFAPQSKRVVSFQKAEELKKALRPEIKAVGVFTDEDPGTVAGLLNRGIIDIAQLHGREDAEYIRRLRALSAQPVIQAFRIGSAEDAAAAENSPADLILFDSGAGTGTVFNWEWLAGIGRPYFLAGGLAPGNAAAAVSALHPFAVDVSSGIETDGYKDASKMAAFAAAVRRSG